MIIPRVHFLQEDDQLLIRSFTRRWVVNGPTVHFSVWPFQKVTRRKALTLEPVEYVYIRNTITGELHSVRGPQQYFLGENEEEAERLQAITLKKGQYVRLVDKANGQMRVEQGESSVYLKPTEELAQSVKNAFDIDEHTAVLILNLTTGQMELITEPQVFIPTSDQQVIEKRKRILLEDHEVMVIRDPEGRYEFHRGSVAEERSFFIGPYSERVEFHWSTGIHKNQRTLTINRIDLRPKFMWYEFEVRTKDNVELIIGVTFFWQIVDVEKMVATTDDAPGDVCAHARSAIIQSVSQISLEAFLDSFNETVRQAVMDAEDSFYDDRGVTIHAVEVRSITCKDEATQRILQEIIQETTNRLNRLQKQESQNEVRLTEIKGQIDSEEQRGELIRLQRAHTLTTAMTKGEAEAQRVKAFLDSLGDDLTMEEKIGVFNTLRKHDMLGALSQGNAQLFFTPADVDLSIETSK